MAAASYLQYVSLIMPYTWISLHMSMARMSVNQPVLRYEPDWILNE